RVVARASPDRHPTASGRRPCAPRVRRGEATPWSAVPFQAADRREKEVTGPPWPFALKSSDAKTSGGCHMLPIPRMTQVTGAGTAPRWILSPQGFSEGSHRVVPVACEPRDSRPPSQAPSQSIRAGRQALRREGSDRG